MNKTSVRALFIGFGIFLGFLISKIISGKPINLETMIPAITGGLVAGIVVYFMGKWVTRKKN